MSAFSTGVEGILLMSISRYTGQCVVVFGTASLQQYIFQSNRLKENIGASYLAAYWLGDGLTKATQADRTAWNKYVDAPWKDPLENPVATDKDINVIYVGGEMPHCYART